MKNEKLNATIREQILIVRDTGQTNMFDVPHVARIAYDLDLCELVMFLDDSSNHKPYINFILYGDGE